MKHIFITLLLAAAFALSANALTRIVAHRGYWDTAGSAQNSIASLIKADSIGADACEFDVWLTADDNLVVFHDDVIGSRRIEEMTINDLKEHRLANGETIPTLDEYLNAALGTTTRLVLELKPHTDKERERLAIDMIMCMVNDLRLNDRIDYITFSLPAFIELAKRTHKPTEVYYLNGELSPAEIETIGGDGIDYHMNVYNAHPEWIEDARSRGIKTNVWTVNDPDAIKHFINLGVDFITTNAPVTAKNLR